MILGVRRDLTPVSGAVGDDRRVCRACPGPPPPLPPYHSRLRRVRCHAAPITNECLCFEAASRRFSNLIGRDASRLEALGADPATILPARDLKAAAAVAAALASRSHADPASPSAACPGAGDGAATEQRSRRGSVASTSGGWPPEGASRQPADGPSAFDGIYRVASPRHRLLDALDAEVHGPWPALSGGGGSKEGLPRSWSELLLLSGCGSVGSGPGRPAWVACSVHSGNELVRCVASAQKDLLRRVPGECAGKLSARCAV